MLFKKIADFIVKFITPSLSSLFITKEDLNKNVESLNRRIDDIKNLLTPEKVQKIIDPNLFTVHQKGVTIRTSKDLSTDKDKLTFYVSKNCWNDGYAAILSDAPFTNIGAFSGYYKDSGGRLYSYHKIDYWNKPDGSESEMARFVESFKGLPIAKIESENSMTIKLTKSGACNWNDILPDVLKAIASNFDDVAPAKKEETPAEEEMPVQ